MTDSDARSVQDLDPLAAVAARPLSLGAVVVAMVYACFVLWVDRAEISQPLYAVIAVILVVVAAVGVVYYTHPLRAPFERRPFVAIVAISVSAMAAAAAATWGRNADLRQDWGPIAVVLIILACGSFRPAKDLAVAGLLSAAVAAVVAVGQVPYLTTGDPALVQITTAITVIVAIPLAVAAFVRTMVNGLVDWRSRAESAARSIALDAHDTLARSVQQDRVTILNRDVVPFFVDILAKDEFTDADRDRALEISDTVRSAMVADIDRSWLDAAVDDASARHARPVGAECVQDDERLAGLMSPDQRTAVRALLMACLNRQSFDADGFGITITRNGSSCDVEWRMRFAEPTRRIRSELTPYFSVVGVVFGGVAVHSSSPAMTMRCHYEFA